MPTMNGYRVTVDMWVWATSEDNAREEARSIIGDWYDDAIGPGKPKPRLMDWNVTAVEKRREEAETHE